MRKIVLVNPPITLEERYGTLAKGGTSLPPLGLTILAAVVRNNHIPVTIVDAAVLGLSLNEAVGRILKEKAAFVGLTAVTVSIYKAAAVAEAIKKTNPKIKIIIGGPHLTAVPEETMRLFPQFDIGVIGEGESTIIRLLGALNKSDDLLGIKGLIWRKDGKLVNSGKPDLIENLDSLPLDAWDLLPNFPYAYKSSVHKLGKWPTTSLISSRGCPYNCRFCDNSMFGRKIRSYSLPRLIEIVQYLRKNYGIKDIFFNDDNFVVLRQRLLEFCEWLLKEGIDLSWGCYGRIDNVVDLQMLKTMKKAGCWRISFGLESGSQEALDFYHKNETLQQMEKVIGWTRQAGIRSKGFFMFGNFLETKESLRKTIAFAKRIKLDDFHATFLTPLPGTEIYDLAEKFGRFDKDWKKMNMWYPVFIPHGLSRDILEKYRKKAFLEFYLRPSIIIGYIKSIRSLMDLKKAVKGFYTLIKSSLLRIRG